MGRPPSRPVYAAIGVTVDGARDILGLWRGRLCSDCGLGAYHAPAAARSLCALVRPVVTARLTVDAVPTPSLTSLQPSLVDHSTWRRQP